MKISKYIIYVESPLQFLSSISFLSKNHNKCMLLYYGKDKQLYALIDKSKFSNIMLRYTLSNLIRIVLKNFLTKKIKSVGIGDLRSTRSLLLFFFIGKDRLCLFDDGNYSSSLDQNGSPKNHMRYALFKASFISKILNNKIFRYTIFKHEINRKYDKIIRFEAKSAIEFINFDEVENELPIFDKNKKTLFYIESSLYGWVEKKIEQKIYDILNEYCIQEKINLVVLAHRLTPLSEIENFTKKFKKVRCIKLKFPVELFFTINDDKNFKFAFGITTALHTANSFLRNSELINLKIPQKYFKNKFKEIVQNHYSRFYSHTQKNNLRFREMNI